MQPRLEIATQRAQIEIITHRAVVELRQRRPQLHVRHTRAQMRIDRRDPVMRLDRSAQWQALHIGSVLQMAKAYYKRSYDAGIEAIGTIASEGDTLMRVENGGNVLAELGAQRNTSPEGDLVASALPPPSIEWDPGYFQINWSQHQLDFQWDVSVKADVRVEPGYVEIRVKKHPEMVIRVKYEDKTLKKASVLDKYV